MRDEEWIKNLAQATFTGGRWHPDDPNRIEKQLSARINDTIAELFSEAGDVCDVYNSHCRNDQPIRLLPIESGSEGQLTGLMLLKGSVQLKVISRDGALHTSVVTVREFNTKTLPIGSFSPTFDALGSLYWKSDKGILMNLEIMAKTLFEALVRESAKVS